MECYYHPDRESTNTCAICGKSICKECGLEIAGKTYCKDCLEQIVGLGIENKPSEPENVQDPIASQTARLERQQPNEGDIYQTQRASEAPQPQREIRPTQESRPLRDDSPYNITDNMNYRGGYEQSPYETEQIIPERMEQPQVEPQITQNEQISQIPQVEPQITQNEQISQMPPVEPQSQEFLSSDYQLRPEATNPRADLENKYEKYLNDLYYDEEDLPLGEQLAKDEAQYGSLTRKEYPTREEPSQDQFINQVPRNETPEQMEARIRAEILAEKNGVKLNDGNIHNLNYQDQKEPMNAVDILLTIVLIIVILIVIYYIVYVLVLSAAYPTFMDALYGLTNPQNVINNILNPPQY